MKKTFKQLFIKHFFDSLRWKVPLLLLIVLSGTWRAWPINLNNVLNSGYSFWQILLVICLVPFFEGLVQGYYVWLMQQKPGYLERQQKDKEAADKWKADMAAKRVKYGRWWWLRRHKK